MVIRRELTSEVVDATKHPLRGEVWLGDTIIPGFGLRVWKTGKAFCIRVSDRTGRTVRRSYSPEVDKIFRWREEPRLFDDSGRVRLTLFLPLARQWAQLEIARAKGLAPSREEQDRIDAIEHARQEAKKDQLGRRTLGNLADEFVERGSTRGWSEEYTDRMRSLLHAHIPRALLENELRHIAASDYEELLTSPDIGDATAMALRHLIHQIHRWIHDEGGPAYGQIWSGLERIESKRPILEAETFARSIGSAEVNLLFKTLDMRAAYPAASLCIKTALVTHVPVARCMRAEWAHIVDQEWYPWLKYERRYWWGYRRVIRGNLAEILTQARELSDRASPFVFPSPRSPNEHIRRVDHIWAGTLRHLNWPYGRVSTYARQSDYLRWIDWEWPELSKSGNSI